jgi:outer membrane protein assembly factor BamB
MPYSECGQSDARRPGVYVLFDQPVEWSDAMRRSSLTRHAQLAHAFVALGCLALLLAGCALPAAGRPVATATPAGPRPTPTTVVWSTLPKANPSLCTPGSNLAPLPATFSTLYAATGGMVVALNARDGSRRWSYGTVGSPLRVLLDHSNVYVHSYVPSGSTRVVGMNYLVALGAADGGVRWQTQLSNYPDTLLAANGVVYLTTNGAVSASDGATGTIIWTTRLPTDIELFSATLASGILYVTSTTSNQSLRRAVAALRARDGNVLWQVTTSLASEQPSLSNHVPSVVANSLVYVAESDRTLAALDGGTGEVRWKLDLGSAPFPNVLRSMVASGTGLYVSADSALRNSTSIARYAFNASTGALCWFRVVESYDFDDETALDGKLLYGHAFCSVAGIPKGCVYGIDALTGEQRWSVAVDWQSATITPDLLVNNVMYLNTSPVTAIRADTGATIWSDTEPSTYGQQLNYSRIQVTGAAIYAAYLDGALRALNTVDGTVRWKITLPGAITSLVAGA